MCVYHQSADNCADAVDPLLIIYGFGRGGRVKSLGVENILRFKE